MIGDKFEQQGEFENQVVLGNVKNTSHVHKFGENPALDLADGEADIWGYAPTLNNYVYPTSAATNYISSSDNGDTVDIEITGLDANWELQTVTQTLVGQTKTEIGSGKTWIRIFRARNVGSTDLSGIVYIYENDTPVAGVPATASKVKATINNGNNQTLMALYTVPAGKTAILHYMQASLSKQKDGISNIKLYVRKFGEVFCVKESFNISASASSHVDKVFKISITEKSDIVIRADASKDAMAVSGAFDLILYDN